MIVYFFRFWYSTKPLQINIDIRHTAPWNPQSLRRFLVTLPFPTPESLLWQKVSYRKGFVTLWETVFREPRKKSVSEREDHCVALLKSNQINLRFYLIAMETSGILGRMMLRSQSELQLLPPRTITKRALGDRSFMASAPKLWNRLPSNIRAVNDLNCFKHFLKHISGFRQAFSCLLL